MSSKEEIFKLIKERTETLNNTEDEIYIITDYLAEIKYDSNYQNKEKDRTDNDEPRVLFQLFIPDDKIAYSLKPENILTVDNFIELIDKLTNIPANLIKPFPLNIIALYKTIKAIYNIAVIRIEQNELAVVYEIIRRLSEGSIDIDEYTESSVIEDCDLLIHQLIEKKIIDIKDGKIIGCEKKFRLFN